MDKQVWAEVYPFCTPTWFLRVELLLCTIYVLCEQKGHCVFTTFCSNFFESICSLQFYLLTICLVCNKKTPCHINKRLYSKAKNRVLDVPLTCCILPLAYVWYYVTFKSLQQVKLVWRLCIPKIIIESFSTILSLTAVKTNVSCAWRVLCSANLHDRVY